MRRDHANLGKLKNTPLPGDWAERAACRGLAPTDGRSPHPFFPTRGRVVPPEVSALCGACPVLPYCRHYALHYPVLGLWAGLTEEARVQWRRERRRAS